LLCCSLPLLPLMSFSMMFLLSSFLRLPHTPLWCRLVGALCAAHAGACALAYASHAQHLRHTCPSP
jgi:hypothetical protein